MNNVFFIISLIFIVYDLTNVFKKKRTFYMFYRPFLLNVLANMILVDITTINKLIALFYLVVSLWVLNERFSYISKGVGQDEKAKLV